MSVYGQCQQKQRGQIDERLPNAIQHPEAEHAARPAGKRDPITAADLPVKQPAEGEPAGDVATAAGVVGEVLVASFPDVQPATAAAAITGSSHRESRTRVMQLRVRRTCHTTRGSLVPLDAVEDLLTSLFIFARIDQTVVDESAKRA